MKGADRLDVTRHNGRSAKERRRKVAADRDRDAVATCKHGSIACPVCDGVYDEATP